MSNEHLPVGVIAYREYEIPAPGRGTASIAFTLRRADATPVGDFACRADAWAHGMVSVVDYPGIPYDPVIWLQTHTHLHLTAADHDRDLGDEQTQLIGRYLAVFFSDLAPIAPELAAIHAGSDGRDSARRRASVAEGRRQARRADRAGSTIPTAGN
jgi:hypothetical protein